MRKILSSFILVFAFPFRLLKRTRIDNFIGGLIFGATFSLIVNVLTVQLQETILRQRMLEALEQEIGMNTLQANTILSSANDQIEKKSPLNYFHFPLKYSSDIWTQSSEPLSYVSQLDQETQIKVTSYYLLSIKYANNYVDKAKEMTTAAVPVCFDPGVNLIEENSEECLSRTLAIMQTESYGAADIAKVGFDVLKAFHPTQDRLNNPLLRIIMGNKSTRFFSGQ